MTLRRNEFHLSDLARVLTLDREALATVEMHAGYRVRHLAELGTADSDAVVVVGSNFFLNQMSSSRAGVFLVEKSLRASLPDLSDRKAIVLFVDNAKLALARCSELFQTEGLATPGISELSDIHSSVRMGQGVAIGAFVSIGSGSVVGNNVIIAPGTQIGRNVTIGDGSRLFNNVVLYDGVELGKGVRIHANAVIGADGFGYAQEFIGGGVKHRKIHHLGRVRIGDDVEIGAGSTIDRGTISDTLIGSGTKIDNQVQIGHNCQIGNDVIICGKSGLSGSVRVGANAIIAGLCGIANDAEIGVGSIVGAMSGVQGKIPAGQVFAGNPARPKGEHYRIQGVLGFLPEMYKMFRRLSRGSSVEKGQS